MKAAHQADIISAMRGWRPRRQRDGVLGDGSFSAHFAFDAIARRSRYNGVVYVYKGRAAWLLPHSRAVCNRMKRLII